LHAIARWGESNELSDELPGTDRKRPALASLTEGTAMAEILTEFPSLREEDVRAAIAFAATSAQQDPPVNALPLY
jgi:hypothetical protein